MAGITNKEVLESWKEIAGYLDRDVKTCRRWELELDLPIRRLDGTPRARVFAYKDEIDFWLEDKLNSRDTGTTAYLRKPEKKSKTLWIALSAVMAVVLIGLVATRILPLIDFVSPGPDKPSLAVLYFDDNTGDESMKTWRKGLADLLTCDLLQSQHIRVVDGYQLYSILKDLDLLESDTYSAEDLKKIASAAGVSHLVVGNYNLLGQTLIFDVQIKDMDSGTTIKSLREEARNTQEIWPKVDSLTRRIKEHLGFPKEIIAQDVDTDIGRITTRNPEAFESYIKGRSYQYIGDIANAVTWLKKALEIDPEFAMAYRTLGVVTISREYLQKAFDLRDRVSERERRQIEQVYYFNKGYDYHGLAIESGERLLELYPEDILTRTNIAVFYRDIGRLDKSLEQVQVLQRFAPRNVFTIVQSALTYQALGQHKKGIRDIEAYLEEAGDHLFGHELLARLYIDKGEYEKALREIDIALGMEPNNYRWRVKANILVCRGDFAAAEIIYRENHNWFVFSMLRMIQGRFREALEFQKKHEQRWRKKEMKTLEAGAQIDQAHILLQAGRVHEALDMAQRTVALAHDIEDTGLKIRSLFALGLAQCRMEAWEAAEKTASALEALVANDIHLQSPWKCEHLSGRIALGKGLYHEAVEKFKKALSFGYWDFRYICPPLILQALAEAYEGMGNIDKAQETYERISNMTSERLIFGDIYARSFYHLGRIFEHQGKRDRAIEHYEKFLDLWKNADPGLPEVDDAKSRLAALQ
jgi:tetratricopeptide (TPR) repeat protein